MKQSVAQLAIKLLSEAQKEGVQLFLEGEKLRMRVVKNRKLSPDLLANIKAHKETLVDFLQTDLAQFEQEEHQEHKINPQERPEALPLSFAQQRLWFIDKLEQGTNYHIPLALRFVGQLDETALKRAFHQLLARHEVLRTVFREQNGIPYQYIRKASDWQLERVSFEETGEKDMDRVIELEIIRPFNLAEDYMLRGKLVRVSSEEHVLITVLHHIAADGWSMPIFANELSTLYRANTKQETPQLRALPIQYADYAIWQNQQVATYDQSLVYWQNQLQGLEPINLPTDFPRPSVVSRRGRTASFAFDKTLIRKLKDFSNQQGVTFFMTMLSGFNVLLNKYTGQEDICVGCGIANRTQSEIEHLIGFFVNTLALRNDVSNNPSFLELLDRVKKTTLDAYKHQDVPFDKVVEHVATSRDLSRDSLFQILFMLQNTPEGQEADWGDLQATELDYVYDMSKFDITLHLYEKGEELDLKMEYCTDLFSSETIARMKEHYENILHALLENPEAKISDLAMLSNQEEHQVLADFNTTDVDYPAGQHIADLFEEQVAKAPAQVALNFEGEVLTYQELNEKANQLAHHLLQQGVQAGDFIGVCMERSMEMIIGLVGILKAGAAYVPIDPSYPEQRIGYMLHEAEMKLVLTNKAHEALVAKEGMAVFVADTDWESVTVQSSANPTRTVKGTHPAYVIYTSGSTGRPKGVEMTVQALVNLLYWQQDEFQNKSQRCVLQFTSLSFDVSFQEIFSTLCFGGKLILIQETQRREPIQLLEIIEQQQITHLFMPFIVLDTLAESAKETNLYPTSLEEIITAGEQLKLTQSIQQLITKTESQLINQYGPSESHVVSAYTVTPTDFTDQPLPPIGKPIANVQLYILDASLGVCGVNIPGELYIGGIALANGYVNRDDLTQQRFIQISIGGRTQRVYKTGDLVKWLPNGDIEYIGRADDQVKIRGHRVELGELESVLQQCEGVTQNAVLAKKDQNGLNYLAAYVVKTTDTAEENIKAYMQKLLPSYMQPSFYIFLDQLPVTQNGKVNKRALPEPDLTQLGNEYVAPSTATEKALAAQWIKLLGVEQVSVKDNFFALGGHSLLATRVIAGIRKEMNITLAVQDLFLKPVLRDLAAFIDAQQQATAVTIPVADRSKDIPLSFAQERLWFVDKLQGSMNYHIWSVWRLNGSVDASILEQALKQVVERHEVLRTVFIEGQGKAHQAVIDAANWRLLTMAPEGEVDVEAVLHEEIHTPFDLSKDYMLRARLIQQSSNEHLLLLNCHHIATDGISLSILYQELSKNYEALQQGKASNLQDLPIQYIDYSVWQREQLQGAQFEQELNYWEEQLSGLEPLDFPTDFKRPTVRGTAGKMVYRAIPSGLSEKIKALAQQEGVSNFMLFLTTFHILLHRYTGQASSCIGVPITNRSQPELEQLIGFFINNLPMRCDVDGKVPFSTLLAQVKAATLAAYEHQEVPFEKMVERVVETRDMGQNPLYQTTFTYHNYAQTDAFALGEAQAIKEDIAISITLFDLSFHVTETPEGFRLGINYSTELFLEERIQRLTAQVETLLNAIVSNPNQEVAKLELLPADERLLLVDTLNQTSQAFEERTVVDSFRVSAKTYAQKVAIVHEGETLSYGELDEKSNQLAAYLLEQGMTPGDVVGVCMYRSATMLTSFLAILKAGGAYLPIDPEYPAERIQYMMEDAGVKLVLTAMEYNRETMFYESLVPEQAGVNSILVEDDWDEIESQSTTTTDYQINTRDTAYVIYTSGSTGKPKGVMVSHQALHNLVSWHHEAYQVTEQAHATMMAGVGFDASVWEVWPYLACGATIYTVPEDIKLSPDELVEFFKSQEITHSFVPTVLVPEFVASTTNQSLPLNYLLTGGDRLPPLELQGLAYSIVNNYGPTENAVVATYYSLNGKEAGHPPIGKPISNAQVYLLGKYNELVPYGAIGELCIGGKSLATGYLNQDTLTAEKFISHPFDSDSTKRLYKTGDLARWLPSGDLEYLGRKDDQVQVRGYRIELGEIETVLQEFPAINRCVVLVKETSELTKTLMAYALVDETFDAEEALSYLRQQLPDYMIPSLIIPLESFPLTANGKLDYKALPLPESIQSETDTYVAPRNVTETQLAEIWSDLLRSNKVGIHDNFFALGGDSIITIQVVNRAKRLGYSLQARDLFEHQTIASLAAMISTQTANETGEQGLLTGESALTPIQTWFLAQDYMGIEHYNQALLFKIDKSISASTIEQAIQALCNQHDALRFVYEQQNGVWTQEYGTNRGNFSIEDLTRKSSSELTNSLIAVCNYYQTQMNLEQGKLVQTALVQMPDYEAENRLFIAIHHLAVDGVSWRIIMDDLQTALDALIASQEVALGTKTASYREWAEAIHNYAQSNRALKQLPYWKNTVSIAQSFPTDKPVKRANWASVHEITEVLQPTVTKSLLQEVNQAYRTEINDVLLTALFYTLQEWSENKQLMIGLEGHGREESVGKVSVANTVGWFTNIYPVTVDFWEEASMVDLLKAVKERLRTIPDKGMAYQAMRYLHPSEEIRNSLQVEQWDVLFNYLGQFDNLSQKENRLQISSEKTGQGFGDATPFHHHFMINSLITDGQLEVTWSYSDEMYESETVQQLAQAFIQNLSKLIEACKGKEHHPTPADYGLAGKVSAKELDYFLAQHVEGIPRRESIADIYPLSPIQEGLLFHGLFDSSSTAYTEQFCCDFNIAIDLNAFQAAWDLILQQHSIFRTAFLHKALAVPVQCVHHGVKMPVHVLDLTTETPEKQAEKLEQFLVEDKQSGFAFDQAPLMRVTLIKLSAHQYKMAWTHHHILLDGWSFSILTTKLLRYYEAFAQGEFPETEREDNYRDYIDYVNSKDEYEVEDFWRNYAVDITTPTFLPFVSDTVPNRNKGLGEIKELEFHFDAEMSQKINDFSKSAHLTMNTVVQGVWALVLSKYTGKQAISFGVTSSGRPSELAFADERVGLYINTIPLFTHVPFENDLPNWLSNLQKMSTAAREFQYTPINTIQRWTSIQGELFDTLLVFENYPISEEIEKDWALKMDNVVLEEHTNYLLTVIVYMLDELHIKFSYNSSLLDSVYVEQMKGHFIEAMTQLIGGCDRIANLHILTAAERERLEHQNRAKTDEHIPQTAWALWKEMLQQHPDQLAIVEHNNQLTYRELHQRSVRVAQELLTKGVHKGELVGVYMNRTSHLIEAMLATMMVGAVYVPIDTAYPTERVKYMLEDAAIYTLLTTADFQHDEALKQQSDLQCIALDQFDATANSEMELEAFPEVSLTDLAYIIYTSGTTGKPKGVMVEHKGLGNLIQWHQAAYEVNQQSKASVMSGIGFDASLWEVWPYLCSGATLYIISDELKLSTALLVEFFRQHEITHSFLATALVPDFVEATKGQPLPLTHLLTGGDRLAKLASSELDYRVFNNYGPTENTVVASYYELMGDETRNPPIGKAVDGVQLYVLDDRKEYVPMGVVGELYIGGASLAAGYWNQAILTKEKFISHPNTRNQELVYRTGDLVRWLPDGNLEYVGRKDSQVQIRGFRVELGEIEAVLEQAEYISQSMVLAQEVNQSQQLIAYVIVEEGFDKESCKAYLKKQLPNYMVPAAIVVLESFPLTPNGKVAVQELPSPEVVASQTYTEPRNEFEQELQAIWKKVLGQETVGVFDDFFELGGNSLLAMRMLAEFKKELNMDIPIKVLFEFTSIADLAVGLKLFKNQEDKSEEDMEVFEL
ncbi:MAG: amino acid adenylation domain-containing protein [Flammeovirgaceae bacterium]